MNKTLIVMRHGNAAADSPAGDRGRPLTPAGLDVARAAGRALSEAGHRPDLVFCSTATRARQTLAEVEASLGVGRVREVDALYGAAVEGVLDLLAGVEAAVGCVMLVGHNPTFSELVRYMAGRGDDTGALAPGDVVVLESADASWAERRPGRWRVAARIGR